MEEKEAVLFGFGLYALEGKGKKEKERPQLRVSEWGWDECSFLLEPLFSASNRSFARAWALLGSARLQPLAPAQPLGLLLASTSLVFCWAVFRWRMRDEEPVWIFKIIFKKKLFYILIDYLRSIFLLKIFINLFG